MIKLFLKLKNKSSYYLIKKDIPFSRVSRSLSFNNMSNGVPNATQDVSKSQKKSTPRTFHFLAGLISGVSSAVLLQPADLLKTRVQQSRSSSLIPIFKSIISNPNPIVSLWRGTVPSALRTGFGSALYFTSLSTLRQLISNKNIITTPNTKNSDTIQNDGIQKSRESSVLPKLSNTQNLITGATARVFAGFILMPFTVIKVRYESDLYSYKSITSAGRSIFAGEGFKGFFSGFGATAVRDAPYAGLYVLFYEASKTRLNRFFTTTTSSRQDETSTTTNSSSSAVSSASINASSGVFAAGLATAITNPFDAVKTRVQLMPKKYGNMLKAVKLMLKEDGIKSFFDGLGLRMARKAISSALAWTVYEDLIGRAEGRLLAKQRDENEGAAIV